MEARVVLIAASMLVALTSCASTDPTKPTAATPTNAAAVSEAPEPEPMPLTSHVVSQIAGWKAAGPPEQGDLKSFAKSHREKVAELEEKGVLGGVTVMFQPEVKGKANAMSTAEQFASAVQPRPRPRGCSVSTRSRNRTPRSRHWRFRVSRACRRFR